MPVTRQTINLTRQLRVQVGSSADEATRALAKAWVSAWDEIRGQMRGAMHELVALQTQLGRWPQPWELARVHRLQVALATAERKLAELGGLAGVTVTDALGHVVDATATLDPRIIASQLPGTEQADAMRRFAARVLPTALDAITRRIQSQIVAETRPLSAEAMDAMRRALVTGVATGDHPSRVAGDMVRRVEGAFNGGLARAMTIARTEILDTYRTVSLYSHSQNADVLEGWEWHATLDGRTCPSCWSMNGTVFPVTTPGPWDHPNGRCARVPAVKDWSALGIHTPMPPPITRDAEAIFKALPEADQLAIMGPGRLELLRSGRIQWSDLATRRDNTGWRPSFQPTPLHELQRRAGPATATVTRAADRTAQDLVAELKRAIASGIQDAVRLGGGQASYTQLVTFKNGTKAVSKVDKDVADAKRAADAENLASQLAQAAGLPVPAVRQVGDIVYMTYVDGAQVGGDAFRTPWAGAEVTDQALINLLDSDEGRRLGLFDMVVGNTDRNDGNWLIDRDGRLVGIDHGYAFMERGVGRVSDEERYLMEYITAPNNLFANRLLNFDEQGGIGGTRAFSIADLEHVRAALRELRPAFLQAHRTNWYNAAMRRIKWLEQYASGSGTMF